MACKKTLHLLKMYSLVVLTWDITSIKVMNMTLTPQNFLMAFGKPSSGICWSFCHSRFSWHSRIFYINEIKQFILVFVASSSQLILRLIHVVLCISNSLLSISEQYSSRYPTVGLSINLLMDIWVVSSFWL